MSQRFVGWAGHGNFAESVVEIQDCVMSGFLGLPFVLFYIPAVPTTPQDIPFA